MSYVSVDDAFTKKVERASADRRESERENKRIRERALEHAEKREWAHKKYGDERRANEPNRRRD